MIINITPDKERAKSIIKMTKQREQAISKLKESKYPTIIAENYYEIIKELLSASLYIEGRKSKGEYAHKDLIKEASKILNLTPEESSIIDNLRIRRNNSQYYAKEIPFNYLETYEQKLRDIIKKLKYLLDKKLKK